MKAESVPTIVGVILCLAISAGVIYGILDQMQGKMKENATKQLDSPSVGPLDDAMADLAGVPRRPKIKFSLPKAKPMNLDFGAGLDFRSSNDR